MAGRGKPTRVGGKIQVEIPPARIARRSERLQQRIDNIDAQIARLQADRQSLVDTKTELDAL
jgi:uncharacterized protein (DUF3084 family)